MLHYCNRCKYDGLIEQQLLYCTVAYTLKQVILSQNKRIIAQVFNGSVLPSNEHFSSNVIQSNKNGACSETLEMLAVMNLNNAL